MHSTSFASKRRLTLLIFLIKCFNKQVIIVNIIFMKPKIKPSENQPLLVSVQWL